MRYNSFVGYYREKFGERLQKLVIDAGFTCPNRDGSISRGGCTFCDNAAFHPGYSVPGKTIARQIDEGIEFHRFRYGRVHNFLAYFQSYSNTYGPLSRLREVFEEALAHPSIDGIVIGTRPDCIDDEKLEYIASLKSRTRVVTLEYGIESVYDETLRHINRGHDFACAVEAVKKTAALGIDVGAHFILGLPGETPEKILEGVRLINELPLLSVKFHQLQIVKGTMMEKEFASNPEAFYQPTLPEYLDFVIDLLERLRPDLYVERVAGEVPPRFTDVNRWGLVRNFEILRMLEKRLEERDARQGRLYEKF